MKKIEVIALGLRNIYSVCYIKIYSKGDIYLIHKVAGSDLHTSRHTSGEYHWKSRAMDFEKKLGKRKPINDFQGIEFLGVNAFGLDSLPKLYSEYKLKKCNGIFAVDMREYGNNSFNLAFFIVTEKGLPSLFNSYKESKKRQVYLFTDNKPMIALIAFDIEGLIK